MNAFFLFTQLIFFYGLAIFLIIKKNERSIFYLPVLLFVEKVTDTPQPAWLFYGVVSMVILIVLWNAIRNGSYFRNNIWALLLIIYFFGLLTKSTDLELIRPYVFSVIWLFFLIPAIPSIYKKLSRDVIFNELTNASLLVLILFLANTAVSTVYKFAPAEMYGITSGVLFGNLYAVAFNSLPIALFIVFRKGVSERKLLYIVLSVVSIFFIMLTLRRTVMALSAFGAVIGLLTLMAQQKAKMVFLLGGLIVTTGYFIYANTDFMQEFKQRVELRKLDDRQLSEEKRFIEYTLLYDDMFVYKAYSPWFGFGLFNSIGNYGQGILGDRSLHGDIPNLVHSSGLIGVVLYLLMTGTALWQAIRAAKRYQDKLIVLFCAATFLVYTVTGRYTETAATLLLFLVLMLPLASDELQ